MAKSIHSLFCFRKKRTIERKKKRSKISGLESCYADRIYVLIGVELRPYGQKLVKFCTHTHTHTHARAAKLVVEILALLTCSTFDDVTDDVILPLGGVGQFFYVRASPVSIRICVPNCVAVRRSCRKGGWYRQTDKGTLQLYIVDGKVRIKYLSRVIC